MPGQVSNYKPADKPANVRPIIGIRNHEADQQSPHCRSRISRFHVAAEAGSLIHSEGDHRADQPEDSCRSSDTKRRSENAGSKKSGDRTANIDHKQPPRAEGFFSLRSKIVEPPGIHRDVDDAGMEETGRNQSPPFPMKNIAGFFGSKQEERAATEIEESTTTSILLVEQRHRQIQKSIHGKNVDDQLAVLRQKATQLACRIQIGLWRRRQLELAIRTNPVGSADESPAVRANWSRLHYLIVKWGDWYELESQTNC